MRTAVQVRTIPRLHWHEGAGASQHRGARDDGGKPRAGIDNVEWRSAMKFIVQWEGQPATQQSAIERFMKTGGLPPDGIKLLGRWHAIGELRGVAIVEANDPAAMMDWTLQWSDLFSFDVTPVMSDEELGAALAAHRGASK
jgi:hypothetical protein